MITIRTSFFHVSLGSLLNGILHEIQSLQFVFGLFNSHQSKSNFPFDAFIGNLSHKLYLKVNNMFIIPISFVMLLFTVGIFGSNYSILFTASQEKYINLLVP
jgi:hypothetical protein